MQIIILMWNDIYVKAINLKLLVPHLHSQSLHAEIKLRTKLNNFNTK